jgi:peptide/nickel transport system substrate-binding protein
MTGPLEYNFSLAAANQLEAAGFNIELERMEWATLTDRRSNPEIWDAFSTGFTFRADPTMMAVVRPTYAGWWENEELQSLLDQIALEEDFEVRYDLWEQVQLLFYEEVPTVKIGDYSNLRILRDNVNGFTNLNEIFFWNVWLAE